MLIASLIGAGAVRALVVRDSMQVLTTAPSPFPTGTFDGGARLEPRQMRPGCGWHGTPRLIAC